jgi:hypothetical protein
MARFFQRFMDLLPARHGNDPTHGVLTDAAGNRTLDTFVSGKRSPDTDLTSPYSQAITVQDHAEGHAAARIVNWRGTRDYRERRCISTTSLVPE